MSQYDFDIDSAVDTGTTLATALESFRDALYSSHSGTSAPSYIVAGMLWIDTTTATAWEVNIYDGTHNVLMGYINSSTGVFTPLPLGQVGTKDVDETDIADGKILQYDSASGDLVYVSPS